MATSSTIFDTALGRRRLARAAAAPADFLLARSADDIVERLAAIRRDFATIADVGTPGPHLAAALVARDRHATILHVAPLAQDGGRVGDGAVRVVGDAEIPPLAPEGFDLVVSALALQAVNDLPGALVQLRRALKPDGLFLGALVGGATLQELRAILTEAETAVRGGASPRVAPFADVRDLGGLLQRAGFALPVADSEVLTVRYDDLFALMSDLRAMGATSTLVTRDHRPARREMFLRAAALYRERFADADGRIRATFEIVSLAGWAPHESQQKPARRGSGRTSLAAALHDRSADLG